MPQPEIWRRLIIEITWFLLASLHWLLMKSRIVLKILFLTSKVLWGPAPSCLEELRAPYQTENLPVHNPVVTVATPVRIIITFTADSSHLSCAAIDHETLSADRFFSPCWFLSSSLCVINMHYLLDVGLFFRPSLPICPLTGGSLHLFLLKVFSC